MAKNKEELTAQQRKYTELLVQGVAQGDAYRKAFGENGKSVSSINSAASRLAKNVKILQYRRSLETAAAGAAIASRVEIMETHTAIMRDKELPAIDRQRSMSELTKMMGGYEQVESQTNVQVNVATFSEVLREVSGDGSSAGAAG